MSFTSRFSFHLRLSAVGRRRLTSEHRPLFTVRSFASDAASGKGRDGDDDVAKPGKDSRHTQTTAATDVPSSPPSSAAEGQGWISRILTSPAGAEGRKRSHSSLLSVGDSIYELQTHDAVGGDRNKYMDAYKKYASEVSAATPGAALFGSWHVLFGNQDQVVNLWRYQNGYPDLDSHIRALSSNTSVKSAELDYAKLCRRRRIVITKPFSYWGEPRAREPSHVYDLRSYVLKPGSMIEWGNAWAKGITHRREFNQDVAGFFSQVGQLYMVFYICAYPSMMDRNTTRQLTWARPGWDITVEYTVPLIKKMQSRIMVPTELSMLK